MRFLRIDASRCLCGTSASFWVNGIDASSRAYGIGILSFWLSLLCLPAHAETVKILVQSSALAGSQYYAVSEVWPQIKAGDRLTLTREPDNRHDRNAIRVDWNGRQLGYVPRAENRAVAEALDHGERLEARVSKLREAHDPWQRVEFAVYLIL